eukprot:532162_1
MAISTTSDMKDLTLSSKWSITLHDPSSPHLPCIALGQFNTIFGFWQIYNAIVEKNIVQTLPTCVNITVYRENTQHKPDAINQWHGEWNVELHHRTKPLKIYQKIVLLVIGEQLTNKISGLVLHRVPVDDGKLNFSISIFTDQKAPGIDVKNILLSNDVIDLNYCINKMAKFHPFQIIHIPMNHESNSEQKESEEIDDNIPYVKYSMESLLRYSQLMEQTPTPSQNDFDLQINNNSGVLQDFPYRNCVLQLFGKHAHSYNLGVVSTVSEKLQDILFAEGCVVCMQTTLASPYDKKESKHFEEEKTESPPASFVIAQCPSLGCQHVIHSKCILNAADNIVMRGNHCSDFFKTTDLSKLSQMQIQREIGYHIDTNKRTGKTYQFSFKLNHLISNKNQVSPQWPITIPSYFKGDDKDKAECLQIFFDHTELQMTRGTIQIAIVDQNTMDKKLKKQKDDEQKGNEFEDYANDGSTFVHHANFEIPAQPKDVNPKDVENRIYQLQYADPVTHNALIINLLCGIQSGKCTLLSLRYEFNPSCVSSKPEQDKLSVLSSTMSCEPLCDLASSTGTVSPTLESLPAGSIISLNDHSETDLSVFPSLLIPVPLHTQLSSSSIPLASISPGLASTPLVLPMHHASLSVSANTPVLVPLPVPPTNTPLSVPLSMPVSVPLGMTLPPLTVFHGNNNGNNAAMNGPSLYPNMNIQNNHNSININTINNNIIMLQQHEQAESPRLPQLKPSPSLISSSLYSFENIASKMDNPSQLYHYACSPLGSHYIATKVRQPVYFSLFFEKFRSWFPSLMVNCHGHTVCRAIYSQPHCTLTNKIVVLESLIPSFAKIASNRQGSFALICIMSLLATSSEIEIISKAFVSIQQRNDTALDGSATEFDDVILSQSGYHVIKKFIGFGYPHFNCILDAISADFTKYATHHYGVPVIRSILDTISANDQLIKEYSRFLQLFAQHTHSLVCDQYGNYVIQQLLEISPHFVTDTIKEFMVSKYSEYSRHKFASNVVEKCLKHTLLEYKAINDKAAFKMKNRNNNNEQKEAESSDMVCPDSAERRNWSYVIIRELLYDAKSLINHKYGNYCLQTALSVCIEAGSYVDEGGTLLQEFVETTHPLLHLLRLNVRKKWQQLLLSATHMKKLNIFFDSYNYYEAY